jgi:tetratricopeptide (TPR) repeat protein
MGASTSRTVLPLRLALCLALCLAMSLSAPPTAQAAAPPLLASLTSRQRKAEAQKLVSAGFIAAKRGVFTEALEKFEAAYDLYPSPKILLNIGTSLRHLGRNADAARIYELYLEDPDADPVRAKEVRRLIMTIDELVGVVELSIEAPDDEYEARVDGKLIEEHRLAVPLRGDPGEDTVVVTIGEHPSDARNVTVEAGSHIELTFAPPTEQPKGTTEEETDSAVLRGVGYALGSAGVLGVLIGSISGAVAISTNNAASDECNTVAGQPRLCDGDAVELANEARGQATLSTVAFVLGGAFLGAGAIVLVMASDDDDENSKGSDDGTDSETEAGLMMLPGAGLGLGLRRRF